MLTNYLKTATAIANFYPLLSNPAGYSILPNVVNSLQVINAGALVSMQSGIFSSRPSAGINGRLYIAIDSLKIYFDNGSSWFTIMTVEGAAEVVDPQHMQV